MTTALKRISIVIGPFDKPTDHEIHTGFLVAHGDAMYIDNGKLWFLRVHQTQLKRVYTQASGHLLLGETERGDIVVQEVLERLHGMSGYDFLSIDVVNSGHHDFDLIRENPEDDEDDEADEDD